MSNRAGAGAPAGAIHLLAARQVHAAKVGDYSDGGGLVFRVGEGRANFVFRYTSPAGRRREMGLGPARRANLAQAGQALVEAREEAQRARELLRQGVDPIEARAARREAAQQAEAQRKAAQARDHWTLARCARDYHARVIEPTKTTKHAADWIASLEHHVPAALWNAPIDSIQPPALLSALLDVRPHRRATRLTADKRLIETRQRVCQRLDAVFSDAAFHRRCPHNPAATIKRKLIEATGRRQRGHLAALPFKDAPAALLAVRQAQGIAARALEFTVLTASRTGEVLGAEWTEFDLEERVWTVPGRRMKGGEDHTVYLSARALEVLQAVQGMHPRWVFPSPQPRDSEGQALSNMAMLVALDRLGYRERTTVHGLARATFSTWANETAAARPDVIEACLAHKEGDRVRAAYNRGTFAADRRALLAAWADYLTRPALSVVPAAKSA